MSIMARAFGHSWCWKFPIKNLQREPHVKTIRRTRCASASKRTGSSAEPVLIAEPGAAGSEVERQACRDRLDGCAADRVVELISAADLVTVAARPETEVRAGLVLEQSADQIPARPLVEPILGADRVHARRIVEEIGLELADHINDGR